MTPIDVYFQKRLQISRQEHEIVTNCINGKWATAGYSNKEHEEIAEKAGLTSQQVQALIAGLLPASRMRDNRSFTRSLRRSLHLDVCHKGFTSELSICWATPG